MKRDALGAVQVPAVAKEQTANRICAHVSGGGLAMAVNRWGQEPKDVELVGNNCRVREEALREGLEGVAHVDGDGDNVLAPGDVSESRLELGAGTALDQLHEPTVLLVDDD